MAKYRKHLIMLGITALLGFAFAALDGRVSSTYFCLETVSAVTFAAAYLFGADLAENAFSDFVFSMVGTAGPAVIWAACVRKGEYFGYTTGKFIGGALVCGGIIYLMTLLTRHEVGPLRAALGRNMLPAFFAAAAAHRFAFLYRISNSFELKLTDTFCFTAIFLAVMALVMFIAANRSQLASANTYLAAAMWGGVFAVILLIGKWLEKDLVPILF